MSEGAIRSLYGVARSLAIYWRPGRQRGLRRFYRTFVQPGQLVFDVGAHLGDRTAAFSALGARVVALEPQPGLRRWLSRLVGNRSGVTILPDAVGASVGTARLAVSRATPTVSTLATGWRERIPEANPGFRGVRWEGTVDVRVTTLDALIERYGVPSFCKIDVEGYEAEVLAGLSRPIDALSVEFVAGGLEVAIACVERLERLGVWRYNAVIGEQRGFALPEWMDGPAAIAWLAEGAGGAPSGDLYARSDGAPDRPEDERHE